MTLSQYLENNQCRREMPTIKWDNGLNLEKKMFAVNHEGNFTGTGFPPLLVQGFPRRLEKPRSHHSPTIFK